MTKSNRPFCKIAALLLAGTMATAHAGQVASFICVSQSSQRGECDRYELRVTITTDDDVGRSGAFGIGLQLENGAMAYWTAAGGFEGYTGGLPKPVDGIYAALPATSPQYLVFSGSSQAMCAMTGGQSLTLYAGHGALSPEKQAQVDFILSHGTALAADHVRGAYIHADVMQNSAKSGAVFSYTCGRYQN